MSDEQRVPDPFQNLSLDGQEALDLEFPTLDSDPMQAHFPAPDHKATKPKWWQRKNTGNATPKLKPKKTPLREPAGGLAVPLTNIYMGLGAATTAFNPEVGKAILDNAEACANSLVEYAKTNPAFKRFLIGLVSTSAIGTVIMAHVPIFMAIAMQLPVVRAKQEKMVGDFAEQMANGFPFPDFPTAKGE